MLLKMPIVKVILRSQRLSFLRLVNAEHHRMAWEALVRKYTWEERPVTNRTAEIFCEDLMSLEGIDGIDEVSKAVRHGPPELQC